MFSTVLRRLFARAKASPRPLFADAFRSYTEGRLDEAERTCASVDDVPRADVDYLLGLIAQARGDFAPAAERFAAAVRGREGEATFRYSLGEALVKLGHLSEGKLGTLLDAFKTDQSAYDVSTTEMLPSSLKDSEIAAVSLDLVKKLSARLAGVVVKMAPAPSCALTGESAFNASVKIRGAQSLGLAMAADLDLAKKLGGAATAYLGKTPSRELVEDALGEFLNVVAGNAIALLERKGAHCELDPPRLGQLPQGGHCFDLVTSAGRGVLVLSK